MTRSGRVYRKKDEWEEWEDFSDGGGGEIQTKKKPKKVVGKVKKVKKATKPKIASRVEELEAMVASLQEENKSYQLQLIPPPVVLPEVLAEEEEAIPNPTINYHNWEELMANKAECISYYKISPVNLQRINQILGMYPEKLPVINRSVHLETQLIMVLHLLLKSANLTQVSSICRLFPERFVWVMLIQLINTTAKSFLATVWRDLVPESYHRHLQLKKRPLETRYYFQQDPKFLYLLINKETEVIYEYRFRVLNRSNIVTWRSQEVERCEQDSTGFIDRFSATFPVLQTLFQDGDEEYRDRHENIVIFCIGLWNVMKSDVY